MSKESTLEYIHKTKWLGSKPGLSRTTKLLEMAGRPDRKLKFVHVAGTNGKGSTCAMLESVLRCAGYKTGLYTSPFLYEFNERMRFCGENISDSELEEIIDYIRPFADSMEDDPPTEFELITVAAMEFFKRKNCDIVILEAGMGGELDSTNAIDPPLCAVFTAIGLDHTEFLGDTVEKIAATKAGIIKTGVPVVLYDADENVKKVFKDVCTKNGSKLFNAGFNKLTDIRYGLSGAVFSYGKYIDLAIPLNGVYQPYNAATAVKTLEVLTEKGFNISEQALRKGLSEVVWKGRFEVLGQNPVFILDGAHNPHGIKAAAESFKTYFPDKKIHFIVGAMADKDIHAMMSLLIPMSASFYAVRPDNDRAMSADKLRDILISLGAEAVSCPTIPDAIKTATAAAGENGICVCIGSLYFSAEIRSSYESVFKA